MMAFAVTDRIERVTDLLFKNSVVARVGMALLGAGMLSAGVAGAATQVPMTTHTNGAGSSGAMVATATATATNPTATAAAPAQAASGATSIIDGRLYGNVVLARPAGTIRAFVVLFSGRAGWQSQDQQAIETLAKNGVLAVGVDTPRYAAKLAVTQENKQGCHYLVDDAESLSHQLQREAHSTRYFLPIMAGVGQGALVAERALARAPANTLSGAVMLDVEPALDPRFNPCVPDPTITHVKGFPGFLENGVTVGANATPMTPAPTASAKANTAAASESAATAAAIKPPRQFAKGTSTGEALLAMLKPHLLPTDIHDAADISDLPVIELPASQPSDMLAIVISGDGGWRDLDKTISESLQRSGIPVVGIDALRYFWSAKTPEQTSHDVARLIQVYGARWHSKHIVLIGYSFGASVMPFVYNRLPEEMRAQVSQLSLLGFAPMADFQIRVTGWLGLPASDKALKVMPETAKIPTALMQCFYGVEDTDSACPELGKRGVTVIKTSGGHHFGKDYDELAKMIVTRWQAQIAK